MTYTGLRNIGIIAHVDAGKTTLTERILYLTGNTHRLGEVHRGDTVTDSSALEREKGITINSAAVSVDWRDHRITVIDTPGHIDFNIEVKRSLRVLDGAVVVFDAVAGVEPQSETNWRLATEYGVPRLSLVNKMDRIGADFFKVVNDIETRLGAQPLVLQLPVGAEDDYRGLVDLVTMQASIWHGDTMDSFDRQPIPAELREQAALYREKMLEQLAEVDDDILACLLDDRSPSAAAIHRAIRAGTLEGLWVPVFCGSAFRNRGVQPLLDAVVDYLPAPEDRPPIVAWAPRDDTEQEVAFDTGGSFAALAFKVVNDSYGSLTYLRVYRGSAGTGDKVLNAGNGERQRLGRIFVMQAQQRQPVARMAAGDIVAVQGLRHTDTGDTLCDPAAGLVLESIETPQPVMDIALEPRTEGDREKLSQAVGALVREDPSLHVLANRSGGDLVLSGMGELHLDVAVSRLETDFHIAANVGKPRVAYRETLGREATVSYTHKKQRGGAGQFAAVSLSFAPTGGEDIEFESRIVGASVPAEFIPAVEAGIRAAARSGVIAGYPCTGFKAVLLDGAHHAQDSSPLAFQAAAAEAFRQAARQADPVLLEPLMAVEVTTPPEYMGDCIGDLSRRRGLVTGQGHRGSAAVITATVPLATMFGYIGRLRSMTAGRATFSMVLDRYGPVPAEVSREVTHG